jgi:hypothetical protein
MKCAMGVAGGTVTINQTTDREVGSRPGVGKAGAILLSVGAVYSLF